MLANGIGRRQTPPSLPPPCRGRTRTLARLFGLIGVLASAALVPIPAFAQQSGDPETVAPVNRTPFMNVFRRFEADDRAMFDFYEQVIGLERLGSFEDVGAGGVHRFRAGAGELKLTRRVPGRDYVGGAIADATGLRYITLFFPDADAVTARFTAAGLPAPAFEHAEEGMSAALVQDPDGQWLKLVAAPGQDEAFYDQIGVGLSVSDLEASKAFYGGFAGLEEYGPIDDVLIGATVHAYRHGSTWVSLVRFGADLPADTGSGGIQYVVTDAALVDRLAAARGVTVETPLSTLAGYGLTTVWLNDPDGITNYFAQVGAPPAPTTDEPSE
jgi:catechol 2,3-dioxygenase-like lactoylglutathione lyase family enzyme